MWNECVTVVYLDTDNVSGSTVAYADVRIGDVLIYGFEAYRNDQGKIVVCRPRRIMDLGMYETTFNYLDGEFEEQVDEAILKAYAKECSKFNTPTEE